MEKLYYEAGNVLELFNARSGSLKSLVFSSAGPLKHLGTNQTKKLFALVSQTIKCV